jgi:2-oxoglutarate dehydrogenase E2 component (dihydrolipoamide succinyltransferase)
MKIEVKVPAVGESITEATIGSWTKKNNEYVKRNDVILLLETDKASVEVVAENDGILHISAEAGSTIKIGATVATIDTAAAKPAETTSSTAKTAATTAPASVSQLHSQPQPTATPTHFGLSPAVQRVVTERGLDASTISGTGKEGRLTKADVMQAAAPAKANTTTTTISSPVAHSKQGDKKIVPMTTIRKRIAERLVEAKNTTAMLTTFNEIDMTNVMALRARYKDKFKEKHGVNLGFMGFFVKSVIEALKASPAVNAYIHGTDIEYHNYYNIGIAVSTERGLMVPVIRDVDTMTVAQIEMAIRDYALKARDGKISVDDLQGGTFTITNGGVFGSLMSTPILNSPQSAILGMHKIQDRPVVFEGQVVARPMMYVALSYDHRIIDGKESVGFLVKIKEGVEDPERLLLEI